MNINWEDLDFKPADFACKCGQCNGEMRMKSEVILAVQELKDALPDSFDFVVSSAHRCASHPIEAAKIAAGNKPGAHNTGMAVDIVCAGADAQDLIGAAMEQGFWTAYGVNQKGAWNKRFVHLDAIPRKGLAGYEHLRRPALWSY